MRKNQKNHIMYNSSLCSACCAHAGSSKGCPCLLHTNEYIAFNVGGNVWVFSFLIQHLLSFHDLSFTDTS